MDGKQVMDALKYWAWRWKERQKNIPARQDKTEREHAPRRHN